MVSGTRPDYRMGHNAGCSGVWQELLGKGLCDACSWRPGLKSTCGTLGSGKGLALGSLWAGTQGGILCMRILSPQRSWNDGRSPNPDPPGMWPQLETGSRAEIMGLNSAQGPPRARHPPGGQGRRSPPLSEPIVLCKARQHRAGRHRAIRAHCFH